MDLEAGHGAAYREIYKVRHNWNSYNSMAILHCSSLGTHIKVWQFCIVAVLEYGEGRV